MLDASADYLNSGGLLVICERDAFANAVGLGAATTFNQAANLVFAPFYRRAEYYQNALGEAGFSSISVTKIEFEMPFNVITACLS